MKVFLAFVALSIAVAAAVILPIKDGQIDLEALTKVTRENGLRRSNGLGEIIADKIREFVNELDDPLTLINETSIDVFLNETIHLKGIINVTDVEIGGISLLNITDAYASILPLGGEFGFHIPEVVVSGNYLIDLLETSLFPLPIYGEGPFTFKISSAALQTAVKLYVTLTGHLKMSSLTYDVDVYSLSGRIEGLFSDVDPSGELNEAVNILLNSYATTLFNLFEANLHDNVTELVKTVGNLILGQLTLQDLIDLIGGGGGIKAPVELFNLPVQQ